MITIATHLSEASAKADTFRVRLLKEIAIHYPGAHIIFILDSERISLHPLPENCTVNITGPRIRNRLLKKYYYEFKIPAILQRYNVSVFIPDGDTATIKNARQFLVDEPAKKLKKPAPKNIAGMITYNDQRKNILSGIHKKVLSVLPGADSSLQPYTYEEKIILLDESTGGDEFFMAYIDHASAGLFITVMKAYSIFRKWQKSTMKMVILADAAVIESVESGLRNYKYRDDVIIRPASEFNKFLPAAYAFIDISNRDPYNSLNAFASQVPVIGFQEVFKDAILIADATDNSISEKMMVLYKEEITRLQHIEAGRQLLARYNWKNNIKTLMTWLEQ